MSGPFASQLRRSRPAPFQGLHASGALGGDPALNERRYQVGEALQKLHARGWMNPCGGQDNPLAGPDATAARVLWFQIERLPEEGQWPIVVRVVIAGDSLHQCREFLTRFDAAATKSADVALLSRLCAALDCVAPFLNLAKEEAA